MPSQSNPPPSTPLRVVIAVADPDAGQSYRDAVAALGHEACVVASGVAALGVWRAVRPDALIIDAVLPDAGGVSVAAEAARDHPAPVVLVSEPGFRPADGPDGEHVLAHLVTPVGPGALGAALGAAVRAFRRVRAAEAALEERKVVERTKGAVMRFTGQSEEEAYRRLRRLASHQNRRLVDVAREVLAAADVFDELAGPAGEGAGPASPPVRGPASTTGVSHPGAPRRQ